MYPLLISLYEFGQFLRILLWISVPLVIISMLVTTWLHYRRKRRIPEELLFSIEGISLPSSILLAAAEGGANGYEPEEEDGVEPDQREKIYKGILWMKEKYEQYRDMADRRYEQLKEELARTEKKYQELLEAGRPEPGAPAEISAVTSAEPLSDVEKASYADLLEEKNQQIVFLQQQLDQRIKNFHQSEFEGRENKVRMLELEETQLRTRHQLEEKQAYIDQLEGQLVAERRKIEELVSKLQASSQQLLLIYEELDRSMKPADTSGESLNSPSES